MLSFGKDPMGSKDEVKEDCCFNRMLSTLDHRVGKQQLITAKNRRGVMLCLPSKGMSEQDLQSHTNG